MALILGWAGVSPIGCANFAFNCANLALVFRFPALASFRWLEGLKVGRGADLRCRVASGMAVGCLYWSGVLF